MHDYLFDIDAIRFCFVFGIVVSMYLYERRHVTTGSIVVPGYIGAFLIHPLVLVATFANALATYFVVNRVLPRYVLLYGRNKFSVLVLISVVIQTLLIKLSPSLPYLWESDVPIFVGAGYVIPALIAHDMGRQGIEMTMRVVLVAGTLVGAPVLAAMLVLPNIPASGVLVDYAALAYDPKWVPVAVLLGVMASWAMQNNHGMRAGGFVGTTYIGMLASTWWQVAFLLAVALITWFIVTKCLMRVVVLFGRRKFSTMLLTSSLLSWGGLWFAVAVLGLEDRAFSTLAPVALIPLFVPGLLANDIERVGMRKVAAGIGLGSIFVASTVLWFIELTNLGRSSVLWIAGTAALVTGGILFDRQIASLVAWMARLTNRLRQDPGSGSWPPDDLGDVWQGQHDLLFPADVLETEGEPQGADRGVLAGSGASR